MNSELELKNTLRQPSTNREVGGEITQGVAFFSLGGLPMKGCVNCLWFKTIDHATKAHCDAMVFDRVFKERTSRWSSFLNPNRIRSTKRFHTPCELYESVGAL